MTTTAMPGRQAALRATTWSLGYFLLGLVVSALLVAGWYLLMPGGLERAPTGFANPPAAELALVEGGASLLGYGFATWLIGFKVLHLNRADLRWRPASRGVGWLSIGLSLGAGAAVLTLVLSLATGRAAFTGEEGSPVDYLATVSRTTLLLVPAALGEEIMFRGVAQVALAQVMGRWRALGVVSIVFVLFHLLNPNLTVLSLLNIGLASGLLGVAFYSPGGLWTSFGTHLGWNATLAALGAPVSGLSFPMPWLDYRPGRPSWLTGGAFGPEGGVLATGVIMLATVVASRWSSRETA